MRLRISHKDLGLALFSGVLLILSFPKFSLSVLAWVGLVPLLIALEGKGLKRAFFLSCVTGLVFFVGSFYWIWSVSAFNLVNFALLAVYVSPYVGFWGLIVNWVGKTSGLSAMSIAPPLWVALEYVRSHVSFLSLPWMLLGHSQYQHPSLIQITAFTGVYGLSFLIVLMNAAIAETISSVRRGRFEPVTVSALQRHPLISLMIAGLPVMAIYLYGASILSRGSEGETIRVALVQGNIPQKQKWDESFRQTILDRYTSLTRNAVPREGAALIIWPETAVPGDVQHDPKLQREVGQVAIDMNTHLLVGSSEYAKFTDRKARDKIYNSMVLLSPEGKVAGEYRKIGLVPFGEYEPLRGVVTWPKAVASARGDILPGDEYTLFTVGGTTFGVTICWENIFPDLFREFVKRGARFMVNATNEARFGDTATPHQFLAMSVFRAAENRVAIARVANTGISAFIDPFGRVTDRLRGADRKELFVEGVLIGDVVLSKERTFYTRYGDLFAFATIALCAFTLIYSWLMAGSGRKTKGEAT